MKTTLQNVTPRPDLRGQLAWDFSTNCVMEVTTGELVCPIQTGGEANRLNAIMGKLSEITKIKGKFYK